MIASRRLSYRRRTRTFRHNRSAAMEILVCPIHAKPVTPATSGDDAVVAMRRTGYERLRHRLRAHQTP
jgi:hypothetical protein